MRELVFCACVLLGAALGVIVGSDADRGDHAVATDELAGLRMRLSHLTTELEHVKRDLAAASTPAAATAVKTKLFELRVDIVAVEDELAVLARRSPVAGDF